MIVDQVGYFNLEKVLKLKKDKRLFSIYKTNRNTLILVLDTKMEEFPMSYPAYDRLPYKIVKGKFIKYCKKVYSSDQDTEITTKGWNNNQ